MKRWLFISGIIIIIVLVAIWVYLLIFGAPSKEDIYSALNFGDTTEEGIVPFIQDLFTPEESTELAELRQLTMKRTIGYVEVWTNASTTPLVYFSEAGTGHIYTLDIHTAAENRISNITIPKASLAEISKDGTLAAVQSEAGKLTIINLPREGVELASGELEEKSESFSISDDNTILYSTKTAAGVLGREYDPEAKTTKTIFEVPFREAIIVWGKKGTDTHTVYPKPAEQLEGYLYTFNNGVMERLPASGYGFSAYGNGDYTLYTKRKDGQYQTHLLKQSEDKDIQLSIAVLPEKCVLANAGEGVLCGVSDKLSMDEWHKGEVNLSDNLWSISLNQNPANLIDLAGTSGRPLDVINLEISSNDARVYFQNKIDQSIWIYEPTLTSASEKTEEAIEQ